MLQSKLCLVVDDDDDDIVLLNDWLLQVRHGEKSEQTEETGHQALGRVTLI
jgi:CheY-like chemotaxis protein